MDKKKQDRVKRKKSVQDKGITWSMMCDLRVMALDEISRLLSNPHLKNIKVEFDRKTGFNFSAFIDKDNIPNSNRIPYYKHGQFGYFKGEAFGTTMETAESSVRPPLMLDDIYENKKALKEEV